MAHIPNSAQILKGLVASKSPLQRVSYQKCLHSPTNPFRASIDSDRCGFVKTGQDGPTIDQAESDNQSLGRLARSRLGHWYHAVAKPTGEILFG
jgi:hypothetical protein